MIRLPTSLKFLSQSNSARPKGVAFIRYGIGGHEDVAASLIIVWLASIRAFKFFWDLIPFRDRKLVINSPVFQWLEHSNCTTSRMQYRPFRSQEIGRKGDQPLLEDIHVNAIFFVKPLFLGHILSLDLCLWAPWRDKGCLFWGFLLSAGRSNSPK
jgi:hypothetical protein